MSTKRRRPSTTTDGGNSRAKRIKFTLDANTIHLPTTNKNGTVLVTGAGDFGQLGMGSDVLEKTRPAPVKLDHEIVDVCSGAMHTVCLTKDGKVITFGCNDEGALGRSTADDEEAEFVPAMVELPDKVKQITAGDSHTAALLEDGRVFAWGTFRDSHGNMGLTPKGNEKLPYEIIPTSITIVKIASGADHIVFLTKFGEIYTCGCPEQGQLGRTTERGSSRNARNGFGLDQIAKLLIPAPISLKPSKRLHFDDIWAGTYTTFAKVAPPTATHTEGAGNNGKKGSSAAIYVFGLNNYHQLGLAGGSAVIGPQFTPTASKSLSNGLGEDGGSIDMITSGQHHTLILTSEGEVFALGRKEYGRLGLGEEAEDAEQPVQVKGALSGKRVVWVSCGSSTSFAVTGEGEVYGWGMGGGGQLGTGEEDDCFSPTLLTGKQVAARNVFRVSGGGQHTVMLAADKAEAVDSTTTVVAVAKTVNKKADSKVSKADKSEKNEKSVKATEKSEKTVKATEKSEKTVKATEKSEKNDKATEKSEKNDKAVKAADKQEKKDKSEKIDKSERDDDEDIEMSTTTNNNHKSDDDDS